MNKKSPFFTAIAASILYFIILILLRYFADHSSIDWQGALLGAIIFWIVIFVVHQFLRKRYSD
ncbi:MAG: hypothetical protein M5U10_11825 [Candidatus Methanoperedens sp.]|uniref:hypothetical protein n=1 Tax=Candidatus Methanoperedens nitratireducens TaxID=1392998 RepID=UPI0012FEFE2C|nr:hypothetical protein [Candidatus Methanoperedens nitroreducens]MDJ1422590.1 hypothetical protein [Candidatus Methanoperedens sp.]